MAARRRVLILGATGMLGHMVRKVLAASNTLVVQGTHIRDKRDPFYFDVTCGFDRLSDICRRSSGYDYFINCIGMLPRAISERNPDTIRRAIKINSFFPHELSAFARERGGNVIHISTDGVFSGSAEAYFEEDTHDCPDFYGITKSLGEVLDEHILNLRCSIIGPSPLLGEGLLEWFLNQPAGSVISGFTNHIWNGISTYQFANLCLKIIEGDHFHSLRSESAVFHFAPNEPLSKYELLCLFGDIFEKEVTINATVSGDRVYKRILQTKYQGIKSIFPHGIPAVKMIAELASYMAREK